MRTEVDTLPNGHQRLTWRYQEARNDHLAFEADHALHVAALIAGKVSGKLHPSVSLPPLRFLNDQYRPQTVDNLASGRRNGAKGSAGSGNTDGESRIRRGRPQGYYGPRSK